MTVRASDDMTVSVSQGECDNWGTLGEFTRAHTHTHLNVAVVEGNLLTVWQCHYDRVRV